MFFKKNRDASQSVNNIGQIAGLLRRLESDHALLTVKVADSDAIFSSAVIAVDTRNKTLQLDELTPDAGHELIKPGIELKVSARLQGVETSFSTIVSSIDKDKGIFYYVTAFPSDVRYLQKRETVRVPVRLTLDAGVNMRSDSDGIRARLTDISAGGIGATVLGGNRAARGARYHCSIRLPGYHPIDADVEVRYAAAETTSKGHQRFGAKFVKIDKRSKREVEKVVADLQRDLLRHS